MSSLLGLKSRLKNESSSTTTATTTPVTTAPPSNAFATQLDKITAQTDLSIAPSQQAKELPPQQQQSPLQPPPLQPTTYRPFFPNAPPQGSQQQQQPPPPPPLQPQYRPHPQYAPHMGPQGPPPGFRYPPPPPNYYPQYPHPPQYHQQAPHQQLPPQQQQPLQQQPKPKVQGKQEIAPSKAVENPNLVGLSKVPDQKSAPKSTTTTTKPTVTAAHETSKAVKDQKAAGKGKAVAPKPTTVITKPTPAPPAEPQDKSVVGAPVVAQLVAVAVSATPVLAEEKKSENTQPQSTNTTVVNNNKDKKTVPTTTKAAVKSTQTQGKDTSDKTVGDKKETGEDKKDVAPTTATKATTKAAPTKTAGASKPTPTGPVPKQKQQEQQQSSQQEQPQQQHQQYQQRQHQQQHYQRPTFAQMAQMTTYPQPHIRFRQQPLPPSGYEPYPPHPAHFAPPPPPHYAPYSPHLARPPQHYPYSMPPPPPHHHPQHYPMQPPRDVYAYGAAGAPQQQQSGPITVVHQNTAMTAPVPAAAATNDNVQKTEPKVQEQQPTSNLKNQPWFPTPVPTPSQPITVTAPAPAQVIKEQQPSPAPAQGKKEPQPKQQPKQQQPKQQSKPTTKPAAVAPVVVEDILYQQLFTTPANGNNMNDLSLDDLIGNDSYDDMSLESLTSSRTTNTELYRMGMQVAQMNHLGTANNNNNNNNNNNKNANNNITPPNTQSDAILQDQFAIRLRKQENMKLMENQVINASRNGGNRKQRPTQRRFDPNSIHLTLAELELLEREAQSTLELLEAQERELARHNVQVEIEKKTQKQYQQDILHAIYKQRHNITTEDVNAGSNSNNNATAAQRSTKKSIADRLIAFEIAKSEGTDEGLDFDELMVQFDQLTLRPAKSARMSLSYRQSRQDMIAQHNMAILKDALGKINQMGMEEYQEYIRAQIRLALLNQLEAQILEDEESDEETEGGEVEEQAEEAEEEPQQQEDEVVEFDTTSVNYYNQLNATGLDEESFNPIEVMLQVHVVDETKPAEEEIQSSQPIGGCDDEKGEEEQQEPVEEEKKPKQKVVYSISTTKAQQQQGGNNNNNGNNKDGKTKRFVDKNNPWTSLDE